MKKNERLRQLPSVDEVIRSPDLRALLARYPRALAVSAVRQVLGELRRRITKPAPKSAARGTSLPAMSELALSIEHKLKEKTTPGLRRAVNATGIVLHTGLGRAVLAPEAAAALSQASGYCTLQADLETGRRARRERHVEELLCELTGAQAVTVVNNNAAATMIVLNTLAKDKQAVVSRGQLIEIGGSFRLPEVMETSGALLKEVGTTNRTHLSDYSRAISKQTGMILYVHTSNYKVRGFTSEVPLAELVRLGRKRRLAVVADIGSGALSPELAPGPGAKASLFQDEPTAKECLRAGAGVVTFSADKLLGGPQAGIILGKKAFIDRIRKNPLARVLRVDKLCFAALEATLRLYLDAERLPESLPTFKILAQSEERLRLRADKLAAEIRAIAQGSGLMAEVRVDSSLIGGGALPAKKLPTRVVALKTGEMSALDLSKRLRKSSPPIFARVKGDKVLLDLRTILEGEEPELVAVLRGILA